MKRDERDKALFDENKREEEKREAGVRAGALPPKNILFIMQNPVILSTIL